ncbi:type II toxin-antitoxin system PemK/MazF family toxin [Aureibacillus halotolerans]|uniref:mRNA interferase MazF n=1 Tax=Aureibacillus halotolerans TaxID=1508390 RepID=A0A4R6U4S7_9BACI|nr:type II toxin-antitoxin system PemK/MazF family toxin [Aureibacillus halotolerans]TDQ41171.1 mRNA interferase MazF [Aureibacillus halotolerans]
MAQKQGNQGSQNSKPAQMMPVSTSIRLSKWLGEKFRLIGKVDSAKTRKVRRGQVYWCQFGENVGSEQCQNRPAVVLQNNPANRTSPNTIVAPITNSADTNSSVFPLNRPEDSHVEGHVLLGNIVTISKARLGDYLSELDQKTEMPGVDKALFHSLGVAEIVNKQATKLNKTEKHLEKVKEERNKAVDDLKDICVALGLAETSDKQTIIEMIETIKNHY